MSGRTGIEWTDRTWNPVVGCTKVSQGCKLCYAKTTHDMRHAAFLAGKAVAPQYAHPFERVQLVPRRLGYPLSLQESSRIFVNSVSDLFHEDVPDAYIAAVFAVMSMAERHTFQVLTKRPERMLAWFKWVAECWPELEPMHAQIGPDANIVHHHGADVLATDRRYHRQLTAVEDTAAPIWPLPNVWLGVSVENQDAADERIPLLLQTPAAIRFLSCEPLLGPIDFYECGSRGAEAGDPFGFSALRGAQGVEPPIPGIDWVIVGGESGTRKQRPRPMDPSWARGIRDQCVAARVPFLFKQWGDWLPLASADEASQFPNAPLADDYSAVRVGKKRAGRELDGRTWDEYPPAVAS